MGADATPSAKLMSDLKSIDPVRDWIAQQGLESDDFSELLGGFCERLVGVGVQLWRGHISLPMLHPSYVAVSYSWRDGQGVELDQYPHRLSETDGWLRSPLRPLVEQRLPRMRCRLELDEGLDKYPFLAGLRDEGATDWLGRLIGFGGETQPAGIPGMVTSWTSKRSGGFTDAELDVLERLLPYFALAVYRIAVLQVAVDLMDAYVGAEPGKRILSGQIQQGTAQRLSAAIMIADLRGFTQLADRTPAEDLVAGLNDYLGAVTDAVQAQGGQVLKFLGDGLLAVFPMEDCSAEQACDAALAATEAALATNAAINRDRQSSDAPQLQLDVALHLGEVMYGNVGSKRRLDFTVIGPAVNEASRIESLCQSLGCHVVTSATFADACPRALRSLGQHTLRGVADTRELFTLP
ncbi:MAG: adenylate/guanylate cyclase domain-containing protein [Pseudomonadota bacterium]